MNSYIANLDDGSLNILDLIRESYNVWYLIIAYLLIYCDLPIEFGTKHFIINSISCWSQHYSSSTVQSVSSCCCCVIKYYPLLSRVMGPACFNVSRGENVS